MNLNLQKLFSKYYYNSTAWSSPKGYFNRPDSLIMLLQKYKITSMFDAGCGPRHWIANNKFAELGIRYLGGDITPANVNYCNQTWPDLDIQTHDMTTDPFPPVDLIFSSDVVIHLSNADKLKFLQNFLASESNYLLITHSGDVPHVTENIDTDYNESFPFQEVNWYLDPWNFPPELDCLTDNPPVGQKRMCLWNKQQIRVALT